MNNAATLLSVGCKIPMGLHLDLKNKDGTTSARYTLKGSNDMRIVGGYGITENIPADFMTEWLRRNPRHPAVVNKLIFTHAETASAEAIAKEHKGQRSGLEPLDPVSLNMLNGENEEPDKKALRLYNDQKKKNPDRSRQIVID